MDMSDAHLERALEEYNEKVNSLETEGPADLLMEAYVNRGCILQMMEYRTSALDDLESASEIMQMLDENGKAIDAGTFVKLHIAMAEILADQGTDPVGEYEAASTRIDELSERSRHFDRRSILRMCISASEDLLDHEAPRIARRFIGKGFDLTALRNDNASMNARMRLQNLYGEALKAEDEMEEAYDAYTEAIETGMDLLDRESLDDEEELAVSFISRAECAEGLGRDEAYVKDMEAAILLLEQMAEYNRLEDKDMLVTLHQDLANHLMTKGELEKAEQHLMKALSIGVHGAKDYIDNFTEPR